MKFPRLPRADWEFLLLLATALAGCTGSGGSVPTPGRSGAPPAPSPTQPVQLIPVRFGGALFVPDRVVELPEGMSFVIQVRAGGSETDFTRNGSETGLTVGVATDAPEGLLFFPGLVNVAHTGSPGRLEIGALQAARASADEYRIWLTEPPNAEVASGWTAVVGGSPVRIRVVPAARSFAPACEDQTVTVSARSLTQAGGSNSVTVYGEEATEYTSGVLVSRVSHPESAIVILAPYRRPFERNEQSSDLSGNYPLRAFMFAREFALREIGDDIEQMMDLGWFADLHLRMETPGCEPRHVRCEGAVCETR